MPVFFNQAQLSYNGNSTTSNIVAGELIEVLTATKTAVMDDYVANDDVTYVISIVNAGPRPFTGLVVTDNLGAYPFGTGYLYPLTYTAGSIRYYVNGMLQSTPTAVAGPPLVISGIYVPAYGNATLIYEVKVNQYAPLGRTSYIRNTAVISGGGLSSNIDVHEVIHTEDTANLTISKSICPDRVIENGQITYTFIIQNSGNTAATPADGVVVTDTFNPILNPISVTFNGIPWNDPTNYSYNSTTGLFKTKIGQIIVPPAIYTQDPTTGIWTVRPGFSVLKVTGTV